MNRLTLMFVAVAAAVSGIVTSLCTVVVLGTAQPEPVQATEDSKKPIRVAVVDLEQVSRSSPQFERKRARWEAAQEDIRGQAENLRLQYDRAVMRYQSTLQAGGDRLDLTLLSVEVKALEETMKAAREEQAEYLQALLNGYQAEVLQEVLENVRRYARQAGYQLVLQDYTLGSPDEGSFGGSDYTETLMSKPVVDAPGIETGENTHVTDITKIMINHMRKGGVPEKDD